MVVVRTILAMALLVGAVFAETKAEISGPDKSRAGDLVVLNSVTTKGGSKKWIVPPELANRYLETEHQIAFSVRENGVFTFHLVAASIEDGKIQLDTDSHVVTITDGFDVCDPPPTEPGDPSDPPPPDKPDPPDRLKEISQSAAAQLNDPTTAQALAETLSLIVEEDSIDKMRAEVSAAVEGVFLRREGESRTKDWLNVWRRPVSDSITANTPAEYKAALTAIRMGLVDSVVDSEKPIKPPSKTKIVFYTRENCGWCGRWSREVRPTIESWGWEVLPVDSAGAVPQFDVTVPGKPTIRLKGFQDASRFREIAR